MPDNTITNPKHYRLENGLQVIDIIRATLGENGFQDYCRGNVIKYVSRFRDKNDPLNDLKKAKTYINFMIKTIEDSPSE